MTGVQHRRVVDGRTVRASRLPISRRRCRIVLVPLVYAALVLVLAATRNSPARGPAAPYDHTGFSEVSVATETVVAGQVRTVVEGLEERGYWCVQPRRNDRAAQIACQSSERDIQVDMVAALTGAVLYADIDLGAAVAAPSEEAGEHLSQVLEASFLKLWPQDRTTIQNLVEDAQPRPFMPFGREAPPTDPAEQFSTLDQRTDSASWSLWSMYTGEPLALRVRTSALQDRSWPIGGSHYAMAVDAATTKLVADGFSCATSCSRTSDGQALEIVEHDGQILAVRFTLRSSVDEVDRRADPSGQWVGAGLPFLTPAVQAAIGQRVQRSRLEHRSWHGLIAGTPIDIVAVSGGSMMLDDRPAKDLSVTIGIPLLHVD